MSDLVEKMSIGLNLSDKELEPGLNLSSPHLLPWDRFSYWVNAILVVTFDIEMGQSVEAIYPSSNHVKLSEVDKSNIAYMSFPDSNSGFLGDTQFHFRIKQDPTNNPNRLLFGAKQTNFNSSNDFLAQVSGNNNKKVMNSSTALNNINYEDYNRKTLAALEVFF